MEAIAQVAKHSRAEDSARLVAVALAWYAQRDTLLAWPSDRELMAFTRLSKTTVHQALRSLERAGEIHRQPRSDGGPRRTYRVNPRDGHQLVLPLEEGTPVRTFAPGAEGADFAPEGAPHVRAGSNQQNPQLKNPPNPPRGGPGLAPDLIRKLQQPAQPPVVGASARAAGARRRRHRRRDEDGACVASEPCPLAHDGGALDRELKVWAVVRHRLRERIGEPWEIWAANAHPHGAADGRLVIALVPEHARFVGQRWGPVLHELAVTVVGCEQLTGVRR